MNLREIETLRTKEELINYFAQRGQSITEEEIEQLKKSYEQGEETEGALTLEQLDEVAGGWLSVQIVRLAACHQPLREGIKSFGLFENAFLLAKDGETKITTSSGEKYIAMVKSYNVCGGKNNCALELLHEETNKWITPSPEDIHHYLPDLYEAIRTFIGDGEGLSLTPIDGVPVNEGRREHDRENQLVHSGEWGPSVLYDSFVNGNDRFDEPLAPYDWQIMSEEERSRYLTNNNVPHEKPNCCVIC